LISFSFYRFIHRLKNKLNNNRNQGMESNTWKNIYLIYSQSYTPNSTNYTCKVKSSAFAADDLSTLPTRTHRYWYITPRQVLLDVQWSEIKILEVDNLFINHLALGCPLAAVCKYGAYWRPDTRVSTSCWIFFLSVTVKLSNHCWRSRSLSVLSLIAAVLGWQTGLLDLTKASAACN